MGIVPFTICMCSLVSEGQHYPSACTARGPHPAWSTRCSSTQHLGWSLAVLGNITGPCTLTSTSRALLCLRNGLTGGRQIVFNKHQGTAAYCLCQWHSCLFLCNGWRWVCSRRKPPSIPLSFHSLGAWVHPASSSKDLVTLITLKKRQVL